MTPLITRRALVAGLGASLPAAGCASLAEPERRMVQVNLAQQPIVVPPPEGAAGSGVSLQTAFDAVLRMTVPTYVDDGGPYTFVVDTGANRSVMATEVAAALRLENAGTASIHGIAGVDPAQTVRVRKLNVGGLVSRRLRMPLLPNRFLGADGLLGVDVLERRRVKLDFRRNHFTVAPSAKGGGAITVRRGRDTRLEKPPPPDPSIVVVPARHRFGQLTIVDAEVDGVPITAFLDSGAQATVGNIALRDAVVNRAPGLRSQMVVVQLISATGQTVSGELSPLPPMRLGGLRLGNLSCVFADLHTFRIWDLADRPAILIGVDVMRHFESIELDFGRSEVTFKTPTREGAPAAPGAGG